MNDSRGPPRDLYFFCDLELKTKIQDPIPSNARVSVSVRRIARKTFGPSHINMIRNRTTITRITTGWNAARAASPIVDMSSIVLRRKFEIGSGLALAVKRTLALVAWEPRAS